MRLNYKICVLLILCWVVPSLYAQTKTVDLTVAYKEVTMADKKVTAIAVNGQIPGPTLHFQEGDDVVIRVHNQLKVGTAVHWHGLLVPWRMDGVESLSQKPIPPQGEFIYHFKIKQSGTYWYHAHADLQEQQGLYGAYDPLVHTIDVGPFQTVTADFDADVGSGWWYMHCHNLYHMKAGMARVLHYDTPDDAANNTNTQNSTVPATSIAMPKTAVQQNDMPTATGSELMPKSAHPAPMVMTNDWQYGHDFARKVDQITATTMVGGDYNKIQLYTDQAQFTNGTLIDADVDIFAWHMLNDFWAIKGGANYSYMPAAYWQPGAGLEGTLP